MNSMKRQRYDTERRIPWVSRFPIATREEQRNSSRRKEEAEPKQKQHTVVNVSGGESKI